MELTPNRRLEKIIILARHGARAPKKLPPSIDNHRYLWDERLGELTRYGEEQMKELGRFIRQQYSHQLGLDISLNSLREEVHMISTESQRTIESAWHFLQGLLGQELDMETFMEQLTVIPRSEDVWFKKHKQETVRQMIHESRKNPEWSAKEEETAELRKHLTEVTGWNVSLSSMNSLCSLVKCYLQNHKDMPLPLSPEVLEQVYEVGEWVIRHKFQDQVVRNHIVEDMAHLLLRCIHPSESESVKVRYVAAHDTTLMTLLSIFEKNCLIDVNLPNFGSYLVFEVWESDTPVQNSTDTEPPYRYVRILYDNEKLRLNTGKSKTSVGTLEDILFRIETSQEAY